MDVLGILKAVSEGGIRPFVDINILGFPGQE